MIKLSLLDSIFAKPSAQVRKPRAPITIIGPPNTGWVPFAGLASSPAAEIAAATSPRASSPRRPHAPRAIVDEIRVARFLRKLRR